MNELIALRIMLVITVCMFFAAFGWGAWQTDRARCIKKMLTDFQKILESDRDRAEQDGDKKAVDIAAAALSAVAFINQAIRKI